MKKLITALLIISLLTLAFGCALKPPAPTVPPDAPVDRAPARIGQGISAAINASKGASGGVDGKVAAQVTVASVIVTENLTISSCVFDMTEIEVALTDKGSLIGLGDVIGASFRDSAGETALHWVSQADAFADYVSGLTLGDVLALSLTPDGAPKADALSGVTTDVRGMLAALKKAVSNAQKLDLDRNDRLIQVIKTSTNLSADASETKNGMLLFDVYAATVTSGASGAVSACVLDECQVTVAFDGEGALISNINQEIKSVYEQGEANLLYGEQLALAEYFTGKTSAELSRITFRNDGTSGYAGEISSLTLPVFIYCELTKAALNAE